MPFRRLNIDFENLAPQDRDAYTLFIQELSSRLHQEGYLVSVDLSVGDHDIYDYRELARHADYLIMMLYDEHYSTSKAGPIASQAWFQQRLGELSALPKDKLVVALGNYGYDWTLDNDAPAKSLTFGDVMNLAREGRLTIAWDAYALNPYLRYHDGERQHAVWFLDGATLYNELRYAVSQGVPNVALWVLGAEDPAIWGFLPKGSSAVSPPESLYALKSPAYVRYVGAGEILRVVSTPKDGRRSFRLREEDGFIASESYDAYPSQYKVARYGKPQGKKVAFTFDDGPDPRYTPQILAILRQHNVKATFFVTGKNALANPELLRQINSEGHEIGVHTFSHPDVNQISPLRFKLELHLTQRLIQELTGHATLLFRPPPASTSTTRSRTNSGPSCWPKSLATPWWEN